MADNKQTIYLDSRRDFQIERFMLFIAFPVMYACLIFLLQSLIERGAVQPSMWHFWGTIAFWVGWYFYARWRIRSGGFQYIVLETTEKGIEILHYNCRGGAYYDPNKYEYRLRPLIGFSRKKHVMYLLLDNDEPYSFRIEKRTNNWVSLCITAHNAVQNPNEFWEVRFNLKTRRPYSIERVVEKALTHHNKTVVKLAKTKIKQALPAKKILEQSAVIQESCCTERYPQEDSIFTD